ncbi:prolyl oligopeptidase family serine peptidase [Aquisalinus flavus]|uniref:Prolyl oligopeptidase n=1 Tax=Aquisalinus flavus TaxID=1526572 RepID=A0A8J2Y6T8_9PROT|nr:prolyl oligopeptidase family serine peptidase [Aquisalinus flavus]MBD0425654.1 S9 family peptidase [Aquisalinus flavus]UNE48731.1 S9 family peptidase [Aquisalinus flavus]GGD14302.1 prolyl oligopeptidase [Aquisalinus flavus]
MKNSQVLLASAAVLFAATITPGLLSSASAQEESETAMSDDPYLWLEEIEGEKALDWVEAQNARSLAILEGDERFEPMKAEALAILNSDERIQTAALRGDHAYNFWQDDANKRGLWRRMPAADYLAGSRDWDVILDIDALAEEEGENWVYSGTDCLAPDYERCIITLSRGGSDAAVRREFDIAAKSFVEDGFMLEEAKASTAWIDRDTMLSGMDLGEGTMTESGYARTVRLWKRGEAIADAPVIFEGETSDVGVFPWTDHAGDKIWAGIVRAVTFYESEYYLMDDDGALVQLPLPPKASMVGVTGGQFIISLKQDWDHQGATYPTGALVAMDPETYEVTSLFEPTERQALDGISAADGVVYAELLDNIKGKVLKFTPGTDGWVQETIALPQTGVVSVASVNESKGDLLVYFESPLTPETLYHVAADSLDPETLASSPAFFNAEGMVTRQYEATSTDGAKIPYFVTAKESVLENGPAPTVQYGYGGFQVSILPTYSGVTGKLWLERDGVYVIANIRGGGEFGPKWHQAGLKGNRQIIYDDFFAVSEDLAARGISAPDHLGILGGSNGGLLTGVSMVQRPDLYNAIGIGVPLLDMLRYDKLLAGASWVGEYGDPDIAEERPFLEQISPYQNLATDADYPVPFIFTSTKDDRVHPGHARKFGARLEEYGHPFLYFENTEGGHSASANREQSARRYALQYVYFLRQLKDAE